MSCYATLKEKGFRLTRPRRLILDYIHERGDHLTAEEILSYVQAELPKVNKSTVYRTLQVLEKNGSIFTSRSSDRTLYHHAEHKHHYHLICRTCGKIIECEEDLFSRIEEALPEKYGFRPELDNLVIEGECEDCAREKAGKS